MTDTFALSLTHCTHTCEGKKREMTWCRVHGRVVTLSASRLQPKKRSPQRGHHWLEHPASWRCCTRLCRTPGCSPAFSCGHTWWSASTRSGSGARSPSRSWCRRCPPRRSVQRWCGPCPLKTTKTKNVNWVQPQVKFAAICRWLVMSSPIPLSRFNQSHLLLAKL